ncbi:hypothetical protein LCGC14_0922130, partial [marine sediment metagenome]
GFDLEGEMTEVEQQQEAISALEGEEEAPQVEKKTKVEEK